MHGILVETKIKKIWNFLLLKLRSLHFYIKNSEALDIQSLFAAETYRKNSWLQSKTPVQKLWVSLLRLFQFKLVEKHGAIIQFFQIQKKLEMPRKAWILEINAEKQKQVLFGLNWSWVFAENSHIEKNIQFKETFWSPTAVYKQLRTVFVRIVRISAIFHIPSVES